MTCSSSKRRCVVPDVVVLFGVSRKYVTCMSAAHVTCSCHVSRTSYTNARLALGLAQYQSRVASHVPVFHQDWVRITPAWGEYTAYRTPQTKMRDGEVFPLQLPEPVLTFRLYPDLVRLVGDESAGRAGDPTRIVHKLRALVMLLSQPNFRTAAMLMHHLHRYVLLW